MLSKLLIFEKSFSCSRKIEFCEVIEMTSFGWSMGRASWSFSGSMNGFEDFFSTVGGDSGGATMAGGSVIFIICWLYYSPVYDSIY